MSNREKPGNGKVFTIILNGQNNIALPAHPRTPNQMPFILEKKPLNTNKTVKKMIFFKSNNYLRVKLNPQKTNYEISTE
jgi:hypothetical protein